MLHQRGAGVLMHISSLPSPYGIGVFDRHARDFIDRIADMGFTYWQVLPFNPIDGAGSPYCSPSAFAGNYLFIDPQGLQDMGLATAEEVAANHYDGTPYTADFAFAGERRLALLEQAFLRIDDTLAAKIKAFEVENPWLTDYSVFMAVKEAEGGKPWWQWSDRHAHYHTCIQDIYAYESRAAFWKFVQYIFYLQWGNIKAYANEIGVAVLGDMPIYVAMDSADVWANQHLFQLDSKGYPTRVAGVPPDYFSATGQLWGNPLYNWEAHEAEHFSWWISRIRAQLYNLDILRVDHFRGFEAFWSIPYGELTAVNGEWVKAPGHALFSAVRDAFEGNLPIIAEDLGIITPEVEALRDEFGFPGMKVLQFAFDSLDEGSYLPHRYTSPVCVCYTGTHDNDTTRSWNQTLRPECRDKVRRYTHCSNDTLFPLDLIGTALASVAAYAIFPLQDVLCVGAEGRMNTPGIGAGNWSWRYQQSALKDELADELRGMTILYGRY